MRTIHRLIEAKKAEREENGEAGFSLIELIIVVVILGILVAIAIPLFANIQTQAQTNALKAAAANGATAAAAEITQPGATLATAQTAAASAGDSPIVTSLENAALPTIDKICVKAAGGTGWPAAVYAGPGANAAGTACTAP
ncbi:type IV pilin protein [Microbacterium hydrocarbonoxydans]|uniref:type IV pilin protein n=1 Tax=Microbacterium hydrocarbonoxydans TaxID=273678 RepID=UPI0007BC8313|nr:prepilin-type N-terminal cleavage/methylation domain-containing protein [Microbacterium hydrocarbonoxydans]GAT71642.1 hypothetical protein MHM582_0106 [Microbacterium sp. HM58-2]